VASDQFDAFEDVVEFRPKDDKARVVNNLVSQRRLCRSERSHGK
jgi:hypothetical protein